MFLNGTVLKEEQRRHFQSWESFWGRPGYGAPRELTQKENLMKMLHYPNAQQNKVNSSMIKGH